MNTDQILSALDEEISRLNQIRELLQEIPSPVTRERGSAAVETASSFSDSVRRKSGRPIGSKNKAASSSTPVVARKRTGISPEGKARIAEAQRSRWAKQKAIEKKSSAAREITPSKQPASSQSAKTVPSKTAKAVKSSKVSQSSKVHVAAKKAPTNKQTASAKKSTSTKQRPTSTKSMARKAAAKSVPANRASGKKPALPKSEAASKTSPETAAPAATPATSS